MISKARRLYLREYQRVWKAKRRSDWIQKNGPCAQCGSTDRLEVDHKKASSKIRPVSAIWSMALDNPNRVKELAKCWVLCHNCHVNKTTEKAERARGEAVGVAKLTNDAVRAIRSAHSAGATYAELARQFQVDPRNISGICKLKYWKHVT